MPCSYYLPGEEVAVLSKRLSKVTAIACALCKQIEMNGNQVPVVAEAWWKEHKEMDRQREADEARREHRDTKKAEALAKLTPEEREMLGFHK